MRNCVDLVSYKDSDHVFGALCIDLISEFGKLLVEVLGVFSYIKDVKNAGSLSEEASCERPLL